MLFYDDFNDGVNGWGALIGNYEDRIDAMLPEYLDMRPPMLSNLTMWDAGTSGAVDGADPRSRQRAAYQRGWSPAKVTRCMTRRKPS